jgi:hypothetical protein
MKQQPRTSPWHHVVIVTRRDRSEHICYVGTSFQEAHRTARRLARGAIRAVVRTQRLSRVAAAETWYCIGTTGADVTPPRRYAYAYRLGRLTAGLRGTGE